MGFWDFATEGIDLVKSEELNYDPADAQPLLEQLYNKKNRGLGFYKTVEKRYENFENKGPGTLYVSDVDGKPKYRFFPDMGQEFIDKQNLKINRAEGIANAPIHLAPLIMPFAMKTVPSKVVLKDSHGTNLKIPVSKGGQTLLQQRRENNAIRKAEWIKKNKPSSKPKSKEPINVTPKSDIVDDAFSYSSEIIAKARHIYKHHPDAGWTSALTRARQLKGVTNKALIKESTDPNLTRGYKKGGLLDPNRDDTIMYSSTRPTSVNTSQQQLTSGSPGMVQLSPRGRGESYPAYFDRIMQTYGARKVGGFWIMDEDIFRAIKNPDARREIAQMLLTQLSQGVKGSFKSEKLVKNLKMNQDLARYNKKYAARADLHHGYPSVIGIEFFLGIPYMGNVWKNQMAIAAKWGNVPGQPMVEGKSNLVSLPSSIPSTKTRKWGPVTKVKYPNPDYQQAADRLEKMGIKVPQHIHQLIHDSFLTNEMGQRGQKFWAKWNKIIRDHPSDATWYAAYEEFNEIIARNRAMYNEAMSQLEAIFSNNPLSENPAKIVDMLEEYIAKGKVTVGKGIVRDKNGKLVILKKGTKTALSKKKSVEYSQDAVKYELEEALMDFKKAIRDKRIEEDPRYADVASEIEYFPKLTDAEKLRMEELLYDIRNYNAVYVDSNFDARRANHVTGITKAEHKSNIKEYYDLSQPKLLKLPKGAVIPETAGIKKLTTTTHRDKKIDLGQEVQLILDFPVRQLSIFDDL